MGLVFAGVFGISMLLVHGLRRTELWLGGVLSVLALGAGLLMFNDPGSEGAEWLGRIYHFEYGFDRGDWLLPLAVHVETILAALFLWALWVNWAHRAGTPCAPCWPARRWRTYRSCCCASKAVMRSTSFSRRPGSRPRSTWRCSRRSGPCRHGACARSSHGCPPGLPPCCWSASSWKARATSRRASMASHPRAPCCAPATAATTRTTSGGPGARIAGAP